MTQMKKCYTTLVLLAIALTIPSCSEEPEPAANKDVVFLNITYKDKLYKSIPTTYDKDGRFIFHDREFSDVYNTEISPMPTLSIFMADDHNIEFYSSLEETFETKKLNEASDIPTRLPQTRVNNVFGSVTLFEKSDFKGMNLIFYLDKPHQVHSVRDFTDDPFHFNNNCSSLTLTNNLPDSHDQFIIINGYSCSCDDISVVFVGYDDKNFTGHTIVCVAQSNRYNTYKHLPGFNNRLSSFKLFMAKDGQYYTHY